LDRCKDKENSYTDNYIKEIQDVHKIEQLNKEQPMIVNKGKQKKTEYKKKKFSYINSMIYHWNPVNPIFFKSKIYYIEHDGRPW